MNIEDVQEETFKQKNKDFVNKNQGILLALQLTFYAIWICVGILILVGGLK